MLRINTGFVHKAVNWARGISSASITSGKLDGRVAIIVAGTNGIGFAFAKRLAEDGAHVVVSSRKQENVDRAVKELKSLKLKASGFACHVADAHQRQEMLKKTMSEFGSIDILIQNAGVNPHPFGIMDTSGSVIDKACEIHIKANFQIVQEAQPYMAKSSHQGSIILTSTTMAYTAQEYPGIYAITKASVISMARAFMPELLKSNIRINCITMGGFDTNFTSNIKFDKRFEHMLNLVPMGRYGKPDECAGLASFLCSGDASYITGENFVVSGGLYVRL